MFKLQKRYISLLLLILMLSVSIYAQEAEEPAVTDAPTEAPTEVITEAPTEVIVTDAPTEAPTEETIVTDAPTEETVVTDAPTEETVVTEEPVLITPEATEVATEVTPIPTEAPATAIVNAPAGEAVEMLIQYNPNASADSIAEMLRSLGAVELERLPQIGFMRVLIPSSVSNTASAQSQLQSNSLASAAGLMSLEPNHVWQLAYTPNDPRLPDQTNLVDNAAAYSIYMESAWSISPRDGQGVTVAVIDSGVDLQHPEFAGKLVAGWDFFDDDNNPDDFHGHGTHVAGVIAAKTNNGIGVAGMAYNAMIMPLRVCHGGCPTWEIAQAIIYATDRGVKVINLSLGGYTLSTTVEGAVNYALSRNVIVVAASGNDGDSNELTDEVMYPASYSGVISVAAVNPDGTIAGFSNSNNMVTIAAPGVDILSTYPINLVSPNDVTGYRYNSGTSMASPHVAGLAAMLVADGIATTPAQVRENLICTSIDFGSVGYDNSFGYGLMQADYAVGYRSNSSSCQVSQTNDYIEYATVINSPTFSVVQPLNLRSVTASATDPTIGGTPAYQTLWYKFTPATSGQYMFSTFGSGAVDTLLGVYSGQPGDATSLTEIASNDDLPGIPNSHSQLSVNLNKSVTYYIQLGVYNAAVSSVNVQLNVNPALTATTLQQETATSIRYTGSWNRLAQTGSSGGYVMTTTDSNATMSFLIRGTELNLSRLVGPTQGNMQIFVDGNSIGIFDNNAALLRSETLLIDLDGVGENLAAWHLIMIRIGSGYEPFSFDAVQMVAEPTLPTALVGPTRLGETATAFYYPAGVWSPLTVSGAMNNNVKETSIPGVYVQFRTSGTAISFFRSTGPGTGIMDVYVDGVLVANDFDNSLLSASPSAPFTIPNLPQRERVVRIENVSGLLRFDGAQSVVQTPLAVNVMTDERSASIVYSGIWTRTATTTTNANAGTLSTANTNATETATASFMFNGNHFCVGYQEFIGAGDIEVYLDGLLIDTIVTAGPGANKKQWCTYDVANSLNYITDTLHNVTLLVESSQNVRLDFIRPVRRQVFTSASGYIAENNAGFVYTGTWTTTTEGSPGGTRFQNGSARRSDANDASFDSVSFHMSGTGFILYTSLPRAQNIAAWEITVDGSVLDITFQDTTTPYLDLWGYWDRFRPFGYGVVDLPAGLHYVTLEGIQVHVTAPSTAITVTDPRVDFDGIRVLP